MKTITISGEARTETGKKQSKAVRGNGNVPCVLYGDNNTLVHFSASLKDFNKVLFTPDVYTIDIAVGGKNYKAVIQDTQFHPITDELIHADFLELADNKSVAIDVPVRVSGNSAGVRAGGKLIIKTRKIKVKALPANLPDFINVDISNLNIGESVKVQDLALENVAFLAAKNVVLVTVATTRAAAAAAAEAAKPGKK